MSLEKLFYFSKILFFSGLVGLVSNFGCTKKNPLSPEEIIPKTEFHTTYETYSGKTNKEGIVKFRSSMPEREVIINTFCPNENNKPLENIIVNFYKDDARLIVTSKDPVSKYLPYMWYLKKKSVEKNTADTNPLNLRLPSYAYEAYKKGVFAYKHIEQIFSEDEEYIINFPGVLKKGRWSFNEIKGGSRLLDKAMSILAVFGNDFGLEIPSFLRGISLATNPGSIVIESIDEIIDVINDSEFGLYISKNKKYEFYEIPFLGFTFAFPTKDDDAIQITTDKNEDFLPAWSYDDNSIVFTSNRSEWPGSLYITDFPGVNLRRLTKDNCQNFPSDWGAVSDWITFKSFANFEGGASYLKKVYSDGSGYHILRKISDGPTGSTKLMGVRSSPSEDLIAYISKEGNNGQLCIVDKYGENKRVVTSFKDDCHYPSWFANERSILMESGGRLYIVDIYNLNYSSLFKGEAYEPDVLLSREDIAFSSYSPYTESYDIFVRKIRKTTKYVQVTYNKSDDIQPRWSPDGKRIAFTSKRSGNEDIWVIDFER